MLLLTHSSAEVTLQQQVSDCHQHMDQSHPAEKLFLICNATQDQHWYYILWMWIYQIIRSRLSTKWANVARNNRLKTRVVQVTTAALWQNEMTSPTPDELRTLCLRPAELLLLLFEEEVALIWIQVTEVSPDWRVESELSGTAQTRLNEGQNLTVGMLLTICRTAGTQRFLKSSHHHLKLFILFFNTDH